VIKTFDGLVAEATGWKKDDKHFIALKTSYDAAQAERFKVATADTEKKEDEKKADGANSEGAPPAATSEPAKPAQPNVEEEVSKANAQLTGWVYEIPAYKYDAIFKPIDELIKK
jgi:hypothetical protein